MERLTERTTDGILVKEDYKNETKTLYRRFDVPPNNPYFAKWDEGYFAMNKLAEYEDLEEQRKLLKLPVAIGDEMFFISMDCPKDFKEEYCRDHEGACENCHHRMPKIASRDFRISDIPSMDRIFATRKSAEAALKEMSKE